VFRNISEGQAFVPFTADCFRAATVTDNFGNVTRPPYGHYEALKEYEQYGNVIGQGRSPLLPGQEEKATIVFVKPPVDNADQFVFSMPVYANNRGELKEIKISFKRSDIVESQDGAGE